MSDGYTGVLVLGMHRSGTSAVAGMLAAAGLRVGAPGDLLPADEHNPKGYFEPWRLVDLDDELLARCGGCWDDPPAEERLEAAAVEASSQVRAAVEQLRAGSPSAWVVKDPRITVLLPIWQRALDGEALPVLVVRHPAEVAASLLRRDEQPFPSSLALWEIYVSHALRGLQGREVVVVPYDELVATASVRETVLAEVGQLLGVALDASSLQESITPSLRRAVGSDEDLERFGTAHQSGLWRYLAELKPGRQVLDSPEAFRRPTPEAVTTAAAASRLRRSRDDAREQAAAASNAAEERLARLAEVESQVHDLEEAVASSRTELKLVVEESGQRALRVAELEAQVTDFAQANVDLAQARAELDQVKAEREQLRTSAAAALDRLRTTVTEAADVRRAANERVVAMDEQLQHALHACHLATRELEAAKTSTTWRAGRLLVGPFAVLRGRRSS